MGRSQSPTRDPGGSPSGRLGPDTRRVERKPDGRRNRSNVRIIGEPGKKSKIWIKKRPGGGQGEEPNAFVSMGDGRDSGAGVAADPEADLATGRRMKRFRQRSRVAWFAWRTASIPWIWSASPCRSCSCSIICWRFSISSQTKNATLASSDRAPLRSKSEIAFVATMLQRGCCSWKATTARRRSFSLKVSISALAEPTAWATRTRSLFCASMSETRLASRDEARPSALPVARERTMKPVKSMPRRTFVQGMERMGRLDSVVMGAAPAGCDTVFLWFGQSWKRNAPKVGADGGGACVAQRSSSGVGAGMKTGGPVSGSFSASLGPGSSFAQSSLNWPFRSIAPSRLMAFCGSRIS